MTLTNNINNQKNSTGFMVAPGNYIGWFMTLIWLGMTCFVLYRDIKEKTKFNLYTYLIYGFAFFLITIPNIYYFSASKKTSDEINNVNTIYANLTLIPFYLMVLVMFFLVVTNR